MKGQNFGLPKVDPLSILNVDPARLNAFSSEAVKRIGERLPLPKNPHDRRIIEALRTPA